MTKQQAIQAMKDGERVTHRFFGDDEYIHMKDGFLMTEEGYKCEPRVFWGDRTDESWNEDWGLVLVQPFEVAAVHRKTVKRRRYSHYIHNEVKNTFGSISRFKKR